MTHKEFFDAHKDYVFRVTLPWDYDGFLDKLATFEELYQAFKARMLAETNVRIGPASAHLPTGPVDYTPALLSKHFNGGE